MLENTHMTPLLFLPPLPTEDFIHKFVLPQTEYFKCSLFLSQILFMKESFFPQCFYKVFTGSALKKYLGSEVQTQAPVTTGKDLGQLFTPRV